MTQLRNPSNVDVCVFVDLFESVHKVDVLAGHHDLGELQRVAVRFPLNLVPVLETLCVVNDCMRPGCH